MKKAIFFIIIIISALFIASCETPAEVVPTETREVVYNAERAEQIKQEALDMIYDDRLSPVSIFSECAKNYVITDIMLADCEYVSQKDGVLTVAYSNGEKNYFFDSGGVHYSVSDNGKELYIEKGGDVGARVPSVLSDFGVDTEIFWGDAFAFYGDSDIPEITADDMTVQKDMKTCVIEGQLAEYYAEKIRLPLGFSEEETQNSFSCTAVYRADKRELEISVSSSRISATLTKTRSEKDGDTLTYAVKTVDIDDDIVTSTEKIAVFSNMKYNGKTPVSLDVEYATGKTTDIIGGGDENYASLSSKMVCAVKFSFDFSDASGGSFGAVSSVRTSVSLGGREASSSSSKIFVLVDGTGGNLTFECDKYSNDELSSMIVGALSFDDEKIPDIPEKILNLKN